MWCYMLVHVSPPEDDTICNLLQLSKFSPSFNKHSTSIFTGYDYEHVVVLDYCVFS